MRQPRSKPTPEQRRERLQRAALIEARTNIEMQNARAAWEREREAGQSQQVALEELEALATARDEAVAQLQKMKIEHNKAGAEIANKAYGLRQAERGIMRVFNEILETIS